MKVIYQRLFSALFILSFLILMVERINGGSFDKIYGHIAFILLCVVLSIASYHYIQISGSVKKLRTELVISKDYLEKIINGLRDAVIITDKDGIIRNMNRSAEKLTFSNLAENIGQPLEIIYDVINEETGKPIQNIVKRILADGKTVEFENNTLLRKKNLETIVISNSASVVVDDEGTVKGAVLVFRDVTDSKILLETNRDLKKRLQVEIEKAAYNLNKKEAFYSGLLKSLVTEIAVIDPYGKIVATNDAWDRFALENGETTLHRTGINSNYFDVCEKSALEGDEIASKVLEGIKSVADQRQDLFYMEYPCNALDKQMWFSLRAIRFYNNDELIIISHDNITPAKRAELEVEKMAFDLIQRNKNIEQFSYIVSHNLRGPLTNILGFAELLKHGADQSDYEDLKEGIYLAAYKIDDIVKDLNNILQIGSQLFENKVVVYFNEIVESVSFGIDTVIKNQDIDIKTDFDSVPGMLTVKSYLYSIFYNLIYNSIKYQKPDKKIIIEIESKKTDTGFLLIFKDNGLGIDLKKYGVKLFGLYKRFHLNTEGKGMGLFMVKTQVETLGGKISAKSIVNEGTEFIIEFYNEGVWTS